MFATKGESPPTHCFTQHSSSWSRYENTISCIYVCKAIRLRMDLAPGQFMPNSYSIGLLWVRTMGMKWLGAYRFQFPVIIILHSNALYHFYMIVYFEEQWDVRFGFFFWRFLVYPIYLFSSTLPPLPSDNFIFSLVKESLVFVCVFECIGKRKTIGNLQKKTLLIK